MTYTKAKYQKIAQFYGQHVEELRAFAMSRTGQRELAEDLVQDTFKRLLLTDKLITEVTLPCLVYTVLRNRICDYWRHRRTMEEFEHYLSHTFSYATSINAESIYSAHEINRLLENGIARLSRSQQRIYRLNIFEGMPVGEISQTLNIAYKSAENHLGAARRLVRSYVRQRLAI